MSSNSYPDYPENKQPIEGAPEMQPVQPGPTPAQYAASRQQNVARAVSNQERGYAASYGVAKFIDYLGWVLLVIEAILLLRFLLKLIGADPNNGFSSFMYGLSNIFGFMFQGLVKNPTFGTNGSEVFEFTTLIAMLVYGLIYLILKLLLRTVISRPSEPVA